MMSVAKLREGAQGQHLVPRRSGNFTSALHSTHLTLLADKSTPIVEMKKEKAEKKRAARLSKRAQSDAGSKTTAS